MFRLQGEKAGWTRGSPQPVCITGKFEAVFLVERLLVAQLGQWLANESAQYTFPIALLLLY